MKPKSEKQIQIPLRLLQEIDNALEGLYALTRDKLRDGDINYLQGIRNEIQGKFERIERHETFTQYKTSEADTEKREIFRQEYLEKAGIHKDWQTTKETHI